MSQKVFEQAEAWIQSLATSHPPLSFRLGEAGSDTLLRCWSRTVTPGPEGPIVSWLDPSTGLRLDAEVRRFADYPAVDWLLRLTNTGSADTAIIADLLPLDAAFALPRSESAQVHHARGSECRQDDFAPLLDELNPTAAKPQGRWVGAEAPIEFGSHGGRSSCGALPFFNLELGVERGVLGAVGWTGDWRVRCWREPDGTVRATAGMRQTHLRLHPGESIRSPRIVLLFWQDDPWHGHNAWRRLVLEHYSPHVEVPRSFATWGMNRAARQVGKVQWLAEQQVPIDNYWIDAGWHGDGAYQDDATVFNSDWGRHVGNWWPNQTAYPAGLAPVGEAAAAADMRFTVWFEVERVVPDSALHREHPEWLLGPVGGNYLYNLGDPAACAALTGQVSQVLTAGGVTCYRQDFNMDAAPFWAAADAPDRMGWSEIRHIEGLYAFWDGLLARHRNLLIDNCSSGGRRLDLETAPRSVPLWRSDYQCYPHFDPVGMQGQTLGLAPWLPLSAGCADQQDTYAWRSALGPGVTLFTAVNPTGEPEGYFTPAQAYEVAWLRSALGEVKAAQPLFRGDFYPLLSYSLALDGWAAWQFDRPDLGCGLVQAFRRQYSPHDRLTARLAGLEPTAEYRVTNADSGESVVASGAQWATDGCVIVLSSAPAAGLWTYQRLP